MKLWFSSPSEDPAKRRLDSGEFVTGLGTLAVIAVVAFFCRPFFSVLAASLVLEGYVFSVSMVKANREIFRYSSFKTREIKIHLLAQVLVIVGVLFGAPKEASVVLLAVNQLAFALSRGNVKKLTPRQVKPQVINL